jgi:small subunit ribosomal protein S16
VEIVGTYNPRTDPDTFVIDEEKVKGWLSQGAQPTMRMHKLLARQGLMAPPTFPPPKPKEDAKAATPAAATPAAAATAVAEPEASAEEPSSATTEEPTAEETPADEPAAEAPAVDEKADA